LGGGDSYVLVLTFINTSSASLIPNGTTRNFAFNINSKSMASSSLSISVNATGNSTGTSNWTVSSLSFPFTFRFSGYVKNETGSFQNATNVSIYQFSEGVNGPPTETLITSALTNENGLFTLSGIDASGSKFYKLKLIYYNQSNPYQALKVGPNLPQFPAEMFYPKIFGEGENRPVYDFMVPPSFNGTTLYLGPAGTINISATNGSDVQRFGYMLMEQGTGFPIESNANTNVTNAQIIVPVGRTYTLMLIRANSQFVNSPVCGGNYMNDTACMTPPKPNSTLSIDSGGQVLNVNMNLAITRKNLYGCIGASGNSSSIKNITSILPKMTPWSGFVPPVTPDVQDINLSNQYILNYSDVRCVGKIAWFNITLLSNPYLVEFYGRNDTMGSTSEYQAGFQNVTMTDNVNINVTLVPLAGTFYTATMGDIVRQTGTNTTKFTIRIQNSTGGAITSDKPHIELLVKNNVFGSLTFIIEDTTNGAFRLALPLNSTVKAKIFSNNAPPKEKIVNLSLGELNITLISLGAGGDGGFRRMNSSGQLEMMNITSSSFNINMSFIRATSDCNVVAPADSCYLTSTSASGFNPFLAMVAGKVNMQMKLSSGIGITFYNFDMFAAKQPPMESVMDNNAISGGSSANQVWQFGSFVPADVYDYAIVSIPYSDSVINDSARINMTIPMLYDENWNVVWNSTRGDTTVNITSGVDDYLGDNSNRSYNSTGYRNFMQTGGSVCNSTNSSLTGSNPAVYCYVNTSSNLIYLRVPHFSGIAPNIVGTAPASSSGSSDTGGSGGSGGDVSVWVMTYYSNVAELNAGKNYELINRGRIQFKVNNETHHIGIVAFNYTARKIIVNVSSTPQQAILFVGDEKKFDSNADGYYDLYVKMTNITPLKASLTLQTINERISSTPPVTQQQNNNQNDSGEGLAAGTSDKLSDKISNMPKIYIITGIIIVLVILAFFIIRYFVKSSSK
jgi:hypothetical protein